MDLNKSAVVKMDTGPMLDMLRNQVSAAVRRFCTDPTQFEAILAVLNRPGMALHPDSPCRAGVLTFNSCYAVNDGSMVMASEAAAAVELQMEAAYLFDNVADQQVERSWGLTASEELALAIAILSCGAGVASEVAYQRANAVSARDLLRDFHRNYIGACCGQYLDANLEKCGAANMDDALNMTMLKSGSLGRFASAFGAGIATDDQELAAEFGEFGFNLFTYLQLMDDLRDACPLQGPMEDLVQRKKTLPLVFFYDHWAQKYPDGPQCDNIILSQACQNSRLHLRREFEASGAEVLCAIVAEAFLNRAKSSLLELKRRLRNIDQLEQFVDSLTFSPQEILAAA